MKSVVLLKTMKNSLCACSQKKKISGFFHQYTLLFDFLPINDEFRYTTRLEYHIYSVVMYMYS